MSTSDATGKVPARFLRASTRPPRGAGAARPPAAWAAACLCLLIALASASPARPQEPRIQSVTRTPRDRSPEDDQQKKNLRMNEVEILGEVEKPKTMFVIPRAPNQYFWEGGKKDFTEEILSPISRQKIEGLEQWREDTLPP